jgi:hypothetical protein
VLGVESERRRAGGRVANIARVHRGWPIRTLFSLRTFKVAKVARKIYTSLAMLSATAMSARDG